MKINEEMYDDETEEDEDEDYGSPQDLPTWPHQSLKSETANMPFIQASFASWDAWARLNDLTPSDGTHAASGHLAPVKSAQMTAENYFPMGSPRMMSRPGQQPASLPEYCFFGGEESRTTSQDTLYPLYGKLDQDRKFLEPIHPPNSG